VKVFDGVGVGCLTREELVQLIGKIDDREFADFCLLSAYTGLRSGELMRLQDEDLDRLQAGVMRITPEQKNKSESFIPYSQSAGAILARYRGKKGRLFRFRTVDWISKKYKFYARMAGLGWSRFHDLRHTFGAHLALGGEREATIQGLMRHKSIISTQVYTRLAPEHLRNASETVNYGPMPVGRKK
jgi:integrase/recombinase XerD